MTGGVGGLDASGVICNTSGEIDFCWNGSEIISGWATSSVICCRHHLQTASSRRRYNTINIRQRKIVVCSVATFPNSGMVSIFIHFHRFTYF